MINYNSWRKFFGLPEQNEVKIEERWTERHEDECGWIPVRPPQKKTEAAGPKPGCKPDDAWQSFYFEEPMVEVHVGKQVAEVTADGEPYDPNFNKHKLTRSNIKQIHTYYNTTKLKTDTLNDHPEFPKCPPFHVLIERCENIFPDVDRRQFVCILDNLKKLFPFLNLKWKYGVLYVNEAKTRIQCKSLDKTYNTLRELGSAEDVEKVVTDLVAKQLSEIFVP